MELYTKTGQTTILSQIIASLSIAYLADSAIERQTIYPHQVKDIISQFLVEIGGRAGHTIDNVDDSNQIEYHVSYPSSSSVLRGKLVG